MTDIAKIVLCFVAVTNVSVIGLLIYVYFIDRMKDEN